ncbi:MAG: type II secretion system protein GspG [Acidobacteria bacterium]|nr:type II secretion system protein GspG [Acidobacteriota bacterium]
MPESTERQCEQCGTRLLAGRRYCLVCQAPVPGATQRPAGGLAEIIRQIPSTRRPDKTLVFVPERREARLKRESRNRRALIAALIGCAILTITAIALWRANERKLAQAQLQRRESMARRELDLYAKSLEIFYVDIGRYPIAKEGLAALSKRPSTLPGWRGPYIEGDFSVDPWGNDYVYKVFNEGAGYQLFTYGPEGEAARRVFLQVNSGTSGPGGVPKL